MDGSCIKARPRVAVFGDGLEGLACAHYLSRSGLAVSVLAGPEPSRDLAARFLHGSVALERFHGAIQPSDGALLGLVNDLDGCHRLVWRRGSSVLRAQGPAPRPPLAKRVHAALALRWIVRYGRYARGLEQLGARSWLSRFAGERVFEHTLEPLLRAQLGELDDEVSAAAAWRVLRDLTESNPGRVGYLRGGTAGLLGALRESLRRSGVELRPEDPAASWLVRPGGVELRGPGAPRGFDALVTTVPADPASEAPAAAGAERAASRRRTKLQDGSDGESARWDTLVSVALVVRSELPLAYRNVCADPVQTAGTCYRSDLLVPREETGGLRTHYFTRRARAGQPVEPREVLEKQARDCLRSLVPGSLVEIEAATVSTARVPAPTRRARVPGPATPPAGPLFPTLPDAHAQGAGIELEASVLAARLTAERVLCYLHQRSREA